MERASRDGDREIRGRMAMDVDAPDWQEGVVHNAGHLVVLGGLGVAKRYVVRHSWITIVSRRRDGLTMGWSSR